jgi:HemY protein
MKALFWVVALVALAVGVTLAARWNNGYVLVVLPPYRIEFSLNLLLLVVLSGFAAGYALVRLVSAAMGLPGQVREYRGERRREKGRAALFEALREHLSGRHGRAERAAAVALELGEQPGLAALLAARAAHELRAWERREAYLARAAGAGEDEARLVTAAALLLEEHRHEEALALLRQLPRRHTAALRLELKAHQQARNWEQALGLVEELRRRNVFDATRAGEVRRYAQVENLKRKALDARALDEAWEKVPAADRANRRVAAAAARCYIALGGCDQAHRIIENAIEADWDSDLAGLYSECEGGDVRGRLERAENWLKRHPDDAALLLTLAQLCSQQGLWGKAQSYLDASLAVGPTHTAHLAAARLQERLGNVEAARRHYRASLELALAQLREATGGRRRSPL